MIKTETTQCPSSAHELIQWEMGYLQEEIVWLCGDIINHTNQIQTLEDNQLTDIENLSRVVDILEDFCNVNHETLEIISVQNKTIGLLGEENKKLHNGIIFLTIWSLVLTILTVVIWLNVFF